MLHTLHHTLRTVLQKLLEVGGADTVASVAQILRDTYVRSQGRTPTRPQREQTECSVEECDGVISR
jgi:hypothetical protein